MKKDKQSLISRKLKIKQSLPSNKDRLLSVVVPAYRQEKNIIKDVLRIRNVLERIRYDYEIVVVVDGMTDKTFENAKKIKSEKIKVIGYEKNHGKGYAVRLGMTRAEGDIVAFIDAGMEINPNGLSMLLEHFEWYKADIIVGSKRHPASKINYPWQRKILSLGYQILCRILFGLNVRDTQAGIKFFRGKVLKDVLPRLLVKQYAFDIELLSVARRLGYTRIFEAPIEMDWRKGKGKGTLIPLWMWNMLVDTLAVFYRLRILHYYDDHNKRKWCRESDLNFKVISG